MRTSPLSNTPIPELSANGKPLVTIAIPTFNRASWLEKSVLDALAQSYENIEVIVSNNASTDRTREVLTGISSQRMRVLHQQENIGLSPNWNACLEEARGQYIVVASDDDRIAPNLVERCVAVAALEPGIDLVVALGNVYLADEDRYVPEVASRKLRTGVWDGVDILIEFLEGHLSVHDCTAMIRTSELRARGGYREGWPHVADLAAWLPLMLNGRVGLVNERCGTYSAHQATQTSALSISVRLNDLEKLTQLLVETADMTCDESTRARVRLHAKHYLARHAIGYIVAGRKAGAGLRDVVSLFWRWRTRLSCVSVIKFLTSPRQLAIVFLPASVTQWVRRRRRTLARMV
jgi:hypothetical protein